MLHAYFMKAGVLLFISSGTTNFSDQYFKAKKLTMMAGGYDSLDIYYTREINRG
jgi:hypothetical protein